MNSSSSLEGVDGRSEGNFPGTGGASEMYLPGMGGGWKRSCGLSCDDMDGFGGRGGGIEGVPKDL